MTLLEKYKALMADLLAERAAAEPGSIWAYRLDDKIADLKRATADTFGEDI